MIKGGKMFEVIMSLILVIAAEVGIPPHFALAVALTENQNLDPLAVHWNADGTFDGGVMQLNSKYFADIDWRDPETNIRAGCQHIKKLMNLPGLNTYWAVACVYNCGYARFITDGPMEDTINYAGCVMVRWKELLGLSYINPVLRNR
jgi:soluble lytic murein transglycosylase-like protein